VHVDLASHVLSQGRTLTSKRAVMMLFTIYLAGLHRSIIVGHPGHSGLKKQGGCRWALSSLTVNTDKLGLYQSYCQLMIGRIVAHNHGITFGRSQVRAPLEGLYQ